MVNWVMSDVGETSLNTFSASCLIPSFPPHVSVYTVLFGSFPQAREAKTFANANFGSRKSSLTVLAMVSVGYDHIDPCCGSSESWTLTLVSGCCDTRSQASQQFIWIILCSELSLKCRNNPTLSALRWRKHRACPPLEACCSFLLGY